MILAIDMGNTNTVIGGWLTASVRQARVVNPKGSYNAPTREGGAWTQVGSFTASGPVTSFTIKHGSTIFRPSFQNAQQVYLSPLTYRTTALAPGCTCPKCSTTALP